MRPCFQNALIPRLVRTGFRATTTFRINRPLSTTSPCSPAHQQLSRLRELIQRVGRTNKPQEKQAILAEYPDLRRLLEHVYDSHVKHHVTSTKIAKANVVGDAHLDSIPAALEDLLQQLSTRQVTGNKAVQLVQQFISTNGIDKPDDLESQDHAGLTLKEVFLRVLDKNLKAGIAGKTLKAVRWGDVGREGEGSGKGALSKGESSLTTSSNPLGNPSTTVDTTGQQTSEETSTVLPPPTRLPGFSCALGKTILRKDLARVLSLPLDAESTDPDPPVSRKWLASRKLDGVRLLVVVDVCVRQQPDSANVDDFTGRIQVVNIWTVSRSGREYYSLDVLKQGLANAFKDWSRLAMILESEPRYPATGHAQGYTQRLVLDGELCHLDDSAGPENPTEDFTQVVSMVRRKDYTIQRPVMFLLDVLPWSVFVDGMGKGGDGSADRYKVFAERVQDCEAVVARVSDSADVDHSVIRHVEQCQVNTITEVEDMIGVAAERGWEGIVLRRGDMPYEGKRSSSILKYKEWQDGEYVAEGIDISTMRLPVNGVYAERRALANVWVDHKGTKVSVGSGFTADERLRYAEVPSLIVGKEMTVEYFAESTAVNRGGAEGTVSLRFPRVKKVWESGKRDV